MDSPSVWLRLLQINDVYELENMASLATLAQRAAATDQDCRPDKILFVLVGDFVGPSLLSSLDKAASMVDCLNAVGVTHVCLGNHETDIPMQALSKRVLQSRFTWINSNMPQLNSILGAGVTLPRYDIVSVQSANDPNVVKRIGLLGLLTDDPSLYRPGSFGNATIEPVIASTKSILTELQPQQLDLIIPLTHQSMQEDRDFCLAFGGSVFPLVLGGHDHVPMDETIDGTRVFKTGMDAHHTGILDIYWPQAHNGVPIEIRARLVRTADYSPDPVVARRVVHHKQLLTELERARLFRVGSWGKDEQFFRRQFPNPQDQLFSTRDNRFRPTWGSTALATMLRMGLRCQCAIVNAGSIRGNKDYADEAFFTWSDLMAELPFPTTMTTCQLPGRVLEATITHSRRASWEKPPVAKGGYIHTCTSIVYNDQLHCIESIQGEDFDPDRLYLTTMPEEFFLGIDNHEPLLQWAATQGRLKDDAAIPAKVLVVEVFSTLLWLELGSFGELDANDDGRITREDVARRCRSLFGDEIADLVIENVMSVADLDGSGDIHPLEMMVVHYSATDLLQHVTNDKEDDALRQTVLQVTGYEADDPRVAKLMERVRQRMDRTQNGVLRREDIRESVGELKRRSLLN